MPTWWSESATRTCCGRCGRCATVTRTCATASSAKGPERERLARLATELGLADRVEFTGQLEHADAIAAARSASVFVMPSVDEAFGVAYVEAMAGWVPVIGALGEPGPAEIARAGDGIRLVAPGDVEQLAATIDRLLSDPQFAAELGDRARATAESAFTWSGCGLATLAAYETALAT